MTIVLIAALSTAGLTACGNKGEEPVERQTAVVQRGDLLVTVTADGNLDMPHEVKLRFGTPGTVKEIYVEEGQEVTEGTLLAKLDDTAHKLGIASAQYNVELAMNEIVEKIHPALMGYPKLYPDPSALLRLEQAQEELEKAQRRLGQNEYEEAASRLRLAQHDLEATYRLLDIPAVTTATEDDPELGELIVSYPKIHDAIDLLEQDRERLADVQKLLEQGSYGEAAASLYTMQHKMEETHRLVKGISGRIRVSQRLGDCCGQRTTQDSIFEGTEPATGLMPVSYPDTSTSLDWLKQVEEELQNIQALMEQGDYDASELAEAIRLAQHEVEMSRP